MARWTASQLAVSAAAVAATPCPNQLPFPAAAVTDHQADHGGGCESHQPRAPIPP